MVFYAGICVWRFFARQPALVVGPEHIALHSSFMWQPRSISIPSITRIEFSRADKLTAANGARGRQGGKCRTGLLIGYSINDRDKTLRVYDNLFEGGVWRLGRAAALIKRRRLAS